MIRELEVIQSELGDVEVVSGDYEEIVRRGRVRNNISGVSLDVISSDANDTDETEPYLVLVSDGVS